MNPEELMELKREKDAVIFAHYYVDKEVQAIADYVGDSFFLVLNCQVKCNSTE